MTSLTASVWQNEGITFEFFINKGRSGGQKLIQN